MYGNRNRILVLSSSVATPFSSVVCLIHLLMMLIGNPLSVNINRKLSSYSWSSDGVHIRLAPYTNALMVAKSNHHRCCIATGFSLKNNVLPILSCGQEEEILHPTLLLTLEFN